MGMLEVHAMAVVSITKGILPLMIKRGSGKIINVSSIAGEQSLPKSVMYGSSKAFLTRFSESLGLEVRKNGIYVQALLPGFTHTDFHDKLPEWEREKRSKGFITWHSSDYVARFSLKKLNRKNPPLIVVPGFSNKILALIPKILPKVLYYKIALSVTR
jgi:uncharacterized protein